MSKYSAGYYHPLIRDYIPVWEVSMATLYCQRCGTALGDGYITVTKCWHCGSTTLSRQPLLLSKDSWELTTEDVIFLRTQGIKPTDEDGNDAC